MATINLHVHYRSTSSVYRKANILQNMMINPIQPIRMYPVMPQQPMTLKIEITPNVQQPQQNAVAESQKQNNNEKQNTVSVYDMPKVSVYEPKQTEKEVVQKNVETKKQEISASQAIAAQANIQPAQTVQAKAAEVVQPKKEIVNDTKTVVHNRPEIVPPEKLKPMIDINGLIAILTNPDYEEQANAMEAMAEVTLYAPEAANEMLDNKVVETLENIMNKDTSNLSEQDKKLADRNKEYAMFTTAMLQKKYINDVKEITQRQIPIDEVAGMDGIANGLFNSNASVREAAIAALGYVNTPEYKPALEQVFSAAATSDRAENVREQAKKQLDKMMHV